MYGQNWPNRKTESSGIHKKIEPKWSIEIVLTKLNWGRSPVRPMKPKYAQLRNQAKDTNPKNCVGWQKEFTRHWQWQSIIYLSTVRIQQIQGLIMSWDIALDFILQTCDGLPQRKIDLLMDSSKNYKSKMYILDRLCIFSTCCWNSISGSLTFILRGCVICYKKCYLYMVIKESTKLVSNHTREGSRKTNTIKLYNFDFL